MSGHEPFAPGRLSPAPGAMLEPLTPPLAAAAAARLAAMEPWLGLGFTAGGLERYLVREDPCLRRFALLAGGAPAGVIAVRYPWLRGAYVELLAVFGEHQGSGLGASLVNWLANEIAPCDRNLWVAVSQGNAGARRFYERHGFGPVGEMPDLVRDGFTELLLRRRLQL